MKTHRFAYRLLCALATVLTVFAPIGAADEPETTAGPKGSTVKLILHPAAEPKPALRYHLLPPLLNRKPGNAAVIYGKAAIQFQSQSTDNLRDQLDGWATLPLGEFPRGEVE